LIFSGITNLDIEKMTFTLTDYIMAAAIVALTYLVISAWIKSINEEKEKDEF
jgi:hypothetical protein